MPFFRPHKKLNRACGSESYDGKRNGYRPAVYGTTVSEKYTGWFKDDMKHGKGIQTYPDGTVYEGDWLHDKRNGYGILSFVCPKTLKALRIYTGQWKDNYPSGVGMKSFPKGGTYDGGFEFGMRHGVGVYFYPNGDKYIGQWHKDQRHGVGRLIAADTGNYYEGTFRNDQKSGLGRYYHVSTGQIQEGVWENNQAQVTFITDDEKLKKSAIKSTEFEMPKLTIFSNSNDVFLQKANAMLDFLASIDEAAEAEANIHQQIC